MRKIMLAAALAASVATPMAAAPALAQDRGWYGDRQDWNPRDNYYRDRRHSRRMSRDDEYYHGRDGRYYCKRNDGTTGLIVGAVGGGVLGNVLGGGTLGTLLGAGGGGLLGRSIDRGRVKCR